MFLADENIPLNVVMGLQREGVTIVSASRLCPGSDDGHLLVLAKKQRRIIVTFDKDFGEMIFKKRKQSYGVILLRIHPQTEEYILSILRKILAMHIEFTHSFCVVEPSRIRVIPLP